MEPKVRKACLEHDLDLIDRAIKRRDERLAIHSLDSMFETVSSIIEKRPWDYTPMKLYATLMKSFMLADLPRAIRLTAEYWVTLAEASGWVYSPVFGRDSFPLIHQIKGIISENVYTRYFCRGRIRAGWEPARLQYHKT